MMAMSKKITDQEPGEIEALLPWHAAGTLNARDTRRVDEALANDPELAKQYAAIREEYAETILLNESLGAPSSRAMQKLFAAIDAEPVRKPHASLNISARIAEFFASLSPRTLATAAAVGALALLLQAGVIGAVLMKQSGTFQTASLSSNERGIQASEALPRWCGLRRTPGSPTSRRFSTPIMRRSSMAPRAACFGCNLPVMRCRSRTSPG